MTSKMHQKCIQKRYPKKRRKNDAKVLKNGSKMASKITPKSHQKPHQKSRRKKYRKRCSKKSADGRWRLPVWPLPLLGSLAGRYFSLHETFRAAKALHVIKTVPKITSKKVPKKVLKEIRRWHRRGSTWC